MRTQVQLLRSYVYTCHVLQIVDPEFPREDWGGSTLKMGGGAGAAIYILQQNENKEIWFQRLSLVQCLTYATNYFITRNEKKFLIFKLKLSILQISPNRIFNVQHNSIFCLLLKWRK